MKCVLPTPEELAESPELAALFALESALVLAERALMSVYPELQQAEFCEGPEPLTAEVCLADAIVTLADALESTISRYRLLLTQLECRRRQMPSDADF